MNNLLNNKKTIIFCILLLIITGIVYLIFNHRERFLDKEHDYREFSTIDKYDANEYIPIYMTEEDVVKKYVNDYKNNMLYDKEEAYRTLNRAYREKRFGSFDKYEEYINNFVSDSTYSMEIDRYSVMNQNGYKIFSVFVKNGYQFIIKEKSIMDIEIFLDEYTVDVLDS